MTATTAPQIPSSRADSAASASSRTSSPSCSGILSTCWAPTVMAAAQVAVAASVPVNTLTWVRRGSASRPHRSAAAWSSTTAAAADHVFLLTGWRPPR
ncbi:Uncharacterised protein [Mycobacterium tuberculosis]|uniref:Uncharacterized protein n=1 Tax=Mycobacterium tuberculosis TaxID=1773 RepID=A0A654TBV9_MYCTX|nr:Uncharacterised protein [Mycobacterium tuberculosis]CKT95988.1 Uncharacterised protein [Mycobacterium tuberculosis]COX32647.1 Uncharacterised protein [Mycobacterium tuberculosis]